LLKVEFKQKALDFQGLFAFYIIQERYEYLLILQRTNS